MRRLFARAAAAGMLAVVLLVPSGPARGDSTPRGFNEAYDKGQDAYNLGDYMRAFVEFEKARDLDPSKPGPHRWLGRTARALKRWNECVASATQALRLHPTSSYSAEIRKDVELCRKALGRPELVGELAEGQAALSVASHEEGAAILVDGLKKGATPMAPFPLLPGKHRLQVTKPGCLPFETQIDAVESIVLDVDASLAPDPDAKPDGGDGPVAEAATATVAWIVVATTTRSEVRVDGKLVRTSANGMIEVQPGTHLVEIVAPGYEPWRRRVLAAKGQKKTLDVSLKLTEERRRQRRIGMIAFGTATAAAAAGIVFGALSNAAYEESEDIARTERERPASFTDPDGTLEPVRTRADLDDAVDRGKRWNLLSGLSYGVAAVSLGASIYYFLGERSEERRGLPLPLAVVPSADGVQLVWDQELDF